MDSFLGFLILVLWVRKFFLGPTKRAIDFGRSFVIFWTAFWVFWPGVGGELFGRLGFCGGANRGRVRVKRVQGRLGGHFVGSERIVGGFLFEAARAGLTLHGCGFWRAEGRGGKGLGVSCGMRGVRAEADGRS